MNAIFVKKFLADQIILKDTKKFMRLTKYQSIQMNMIKAMIQKVQAIARTLLTLKHP